VPQLPGRAEPGGEQDDQPEDDGLDGSHHHGQRQSDRLHRPRRLVQVEHPLQPPGLVLAQRGGRDGRPPGGRRDGQAQ